MNMTTRLGLVLCGVACLTQGCITHRQTVYKDVERRKIDFESDAAARLFYETLSRRSGSMDHSESSTKFELPIVFSHERKVLPGKNVEFNQAVEICDSNKDGVVTELEARVFANLK